ncbi:MAG: insulinase family protein [Planctomycetes bacterium]|nr:insulinase family protein [Planctomycetota bacterium]
MNDPFCQQTLSNGLRVVIEQMPGVRSAAAGFLARTGARDETREVAGISHFVEHMCFKGTDNRDWRAISVAFDDLGSQYNAFTSEDRTFYYGWLRRDDIEAQIELLADLVRPTFPQDQFDTEKNVILEEIAMSKDSLEHVALDFLQERVFEGHPLAWPILGYEETVSKMTRDQLAAYLQRRYAPDNLILVVAGNVEPEKIIEIAERYCGKWEPAGDSLTTDRRTVPEIRAGSATHVVERFNQQLVALNFPGPRADDALDETAFAATSILGGNNSRFFWNIVQVGLSPHAAVYRYDLADCGLMILAGQAEPDRIAELTEAMRAEAHNICTERVEESEVQRVKNLRRTSLATEAESPYHRLVQIMHDVDYRGAPRTVAQRLAAVDAVTVDSVAELFQHYPIDRNGYFISVGPRNWPEA